MNTPELREMSAAVTEAQKAKLEAAWLQGGGKTPDGLELSGLAESNGMAEAQVRTWFKAKRKREKKRRQKKQKKAKLAQGWAESGGFEGSSQTESSGVNLKTRKELVREIEICSTLISKQPLDSELFYRRGEAYIRLSRDVSNAENWGQVVDNVAWQKALQDLEKAHFLRYRHNCI